MFGTLRAQKKYIFPLCVLLSSCINPDKSRRWELLTDVTWKSNFNSARLILGVDNKTSYLSIEISRTHEKVYIYLNLLLFPAEPLKDNPHFTSATLLIDNDSYTIFPFKLVGGQKLLLPDEIATLLIDALLEGKSVQINIGRSSIHLLTEGFEEAYKALMELPL